MDGCLYRCNGKGIKVTGLRSLEAKKTLVRTKASKREESAWASKIPGAASSQVRYSSRGIPFICICLVMWSGNQLRRGVIYNYFLPRVRGED